MERCQLTSASELSVILNFDKASKGKEEVKSKQEEDKLECKL